MNTCFKESRGNKYFYGEIFISNDNIVPDSGRQGLAAGEEADALIIEIKKYFSETLRQVYYRANKLKAALNKASEVVGKLNNPEFASAAIPLTKKLQEHIDEFKKAIAPDSKEEINDIIAIYVNKYNNELKAEVEKYLAPQQPVVEEEPDILDLVTKPTVNTPTEPVVVVKPQSPLTPETETRTKLDSNPVSKPTVKSSDTQKPFAPTPPTSNRPKSQVDEILSSLEGKNYSPEQIAILKRVFSTMLVVCSSSNKKNVILLMEAAVNSL